MLPNIRSTLHKNVRRRFPIEPVSRESLGLQIKIISKLLKQAVSDKLVSLDLTSSQSFVLGYLCYHAQQGEAVYPRDIEKHFGFTHPTVSGLLQRMEAKGFVHMEPSAEDRRCKRILVTDRALQVNRQVLDQLDAVERQMVHGMDEDDVVRLRAQFECIIHNLTPTSEEGGMNP